MYTAIAIVIVVGLIGLIVLRRRPKRLNTKRFNERWLKLQKNCSNRKTWHQAIVEADILLDEALKKRRYKGKTPGERLVAAQHALSTNEAVWFGHKLRNRIEQEGLKRITKQETLEALSGFRQALKDLGALQNEKQGPLSDD
jgi:hypothetical protein